MAEDAINHNHACPWCAFTAERLKPVLLHMESAHPHDWEALALSPLVAGSGPV
jgi:hypothetical protein